ncbi:MAG: short-chain dehydrogenase [Gammaproteobacteria bacterium]
MDIEGKNVLVLGGAGLVGTAVCRALMAEDPARLVIAARREQRARKAVARLRAEHSKTAVALVPAWGDVFLRAEWQRGGIASRDELLADPQRRRRLVDDILSPLDEDVVLSSFLVQLIAGTDRELNAAPAAIVIDCMNTATAVSYQDIYSASERLRTLACANSADVDWPAEIERMLAALYVPQLVRHVQLLHEGMRRGATQAYVKVATTGSGGFGFNIPYTHGEERPSRLLLSKSAVAGAQTQLNFMMARTPDGPQIVKQVTPAACIGWREIGHGPISRRGKSLKRFDCQPKRGVSPSDPANLAPQGEFGEQVDDTLEAVYIDTGENGVFSADEFAAITAPGQMQMVTAEEIALNVVRELRGTSTGRETIAALDASVMGPSHRGGHLREAALERLRQLEAEHGAGVAFEILGPPRLSKLLFEAHLLQRSCGTITAVLTRSPEELATALEKEVLENRDLRQRILSIGIPILLYDGDELLRGPTMKSSTAQEGWVDLARGNMQVWQRRLQAIKDDLEAEFAGDASSHFDRAFAASASWRPSDALIPGEVVAWILTNEDKGVRHKA